VNLHEYQAKDRLSRCGVPTLPRRLARSPEEAERAFRELGAAVCAVKAQVHAGGRGKAGGIRLARSAEEAGRIAGELIGRRLVTHQTGPDGRLVRMVLVECGCDIAAERYVAITIDRKAGAPVVLASTEGGVEIEEVAARNPAAIRREVLDPEAGMRPFQARRIARHLGLPADGAKILQALARTFFEDHCGLLEINPLVVTKSGGVVVLDAKMNIDDRALPFRPDLAELRDVAEEDAREVAAGQAGLNYVQMDGTIGCMVNGAGLAMATMDIIQLHGGRPANFLDVGGGASQEQVTTAFRLLCSDPDIRAILVNIFGGILRCDIVARGIVEAVRVVAPKVPVVVRLEGTNMQEGREILRQSGLRIIPAADMEDAARKAIEAAR
jgi:succinyl-CoA synthetase beta subunit